MRTTKLVEIIKSIAREKESKRIDEARSSHHSTKYKRTIVARNHGASVPLAETNKESKKKTISSDEIDHRPDVIDTNPTLKTISQAR